MKGGLEGVIKSMFIKDVVFEGWQYFNTRESS